MLPATNKMADHPTTGSNKHITVIHLRSDE